MPSRPSSGTAARRAALALAAGVWACGCGDPAREAEDPPTALARGRQLYGQHGCATCHGAQGHGDGQLASSLQPRPRDFRDAASFRQGHDLEGIARTIRDGVAGQRQVMPAYGHLSESELRSLAAFVRSLRGERAR